MCDEEEVDKAISGKKDTRSRPRDKQVRARRWIFRYTSVASIMRPEVALPILASRKCSRRSSSRTGSYPRPWRLVSQPDYMDHLLHVLVLLVYRAHERCCRWQNLVDEDEDRFLWCQLDPFPDHIYELTHGEVLEEV